MRSVLAPILAIPLLLGCRPDDPDSTKTDELEQRIAALEQLLAEADVEKLADDVSGLQGDVAALQNTDTLHDAEIAGLQAADEVHDIAITALESADDVHDSVIGGLQSDLGGLEGAVSDSVITTDTTLDVPAEYADVNAALASLDGKHIASGVIVTIQIADGIYPYGSPIVIDHPDGDNIEILGNVTDGSAVTLQFTADTSGIVVERGNVLGYLDGVTIEGAGTPSSAVGVEVRDNAFTEIGSEVVVTAFGHHGYEASLGGVLLADGSSAMANEDHGYYSNSGALIRAHASTSSGSAKGSGYYAEDAAVLLAKYATSSLNYVHGFAAEDMSAVEVSGDATTATVASENGQYGYFSTSFSKMYASRSRADDNGDHGYYANIGSSLGASSSNAEGNGSSGYVASVAAQVVSENSNAIDNGISGYSSQYGSWLYADGSGATGNLAGHGFQASYGSGLFAMNGIATSNADRGFGAQYGGVVYAYSTTSSLNGLGDTVSDASNDLFVLR